MAPGSEAPASFRRRYRTTAALLLIVCVTLTESAPTTYDEIESKHSDLAAYLNDPNGCYYNYQHYEEGDRIVTNEPCLNCTCHNRMLMCYLRVCPFTKAIGQDCTVQKSPDQCCPTISCPEVPVHLLATSTTQKPVTTTEIGWHDDYGCTMHEDGFFPDGAQVPPDPKKPCELCYCIRNRTACVMQECTLHVEGCRPVYEDGVCCPVRYDCDYETEKSTTPAPQISGGLVFSTTSAPFDCKVNDDVYRDGESIAMVSDKPCEHCYCMRGDIVCAVQDCGEPLRGKDCTPETPPAGQCCPTSYQCANETISSDDITKLQPASQSDSDQNEAEKHPLNENAYNKLGEHQPSQQDDVNNDESNNEDSNNSYTTQANMNDVTDSNQITNTNENVHNNAPNNNNNNVIGESNILPVSDDLNKFASDKNTETSSAKPESPADQVKPTGTESDQINNENTSAPVESTVVNEEQTTVLPASDPLLNENVVNLTNQTSSVENGNIKIIEENKGDESPAINPSQNDLTPNIPRITTENSLESETQSSNLQDKPQEIIPQQTYSPAIIENDPIKSSNDKQEPEKQSDDKSTIEATSDKNQNNEESTETYTGDSKYPTVSSQMQDTEQATQKISQDTTENTPLKETNIQIGVEQDSPNQSNLDSTQISQVNGFNTESPYNVEQKIPNNDKSQEENTSPPEITKVDNEPVQQVSMTEETKPLTDKLPESEKIPSEQKPDNLHEEYAFSTEASKLENETTEQNKLPQENKPEIESQTESEKITFDENQESTQEENVSPTEVSKIENQNGQQEENVSPTVVPKIENQNGQQEENVSQNGISEIENQPTEQNKPIENNESSTDNPKVENQPNGQNMPLADTTSQNENLPELQKTPTKQNQVSPQFENESSFEIPNVEHEPVEQNKPMTENNSQTENQPESEKTSTEEIHQESPQSDSKPSTEIPTIQNEPTQQNTPLVESSSVLENNPQTNKTLTDQNNQDDSQSENVLTTNTPEIENEPIEPNKPQEASHPLVENQPESQTSPTETNQDGLQIENSSSTEIPKIENEPIEQNTALEINNQQTDKQPESQTYPTEQDKLQTENESSTEISDVKNKPMIQNTPQAESNSQTENQPENQKPPINQNQDVPQVENTHSTDSSTIGSSSIEQNKPTVDNNSQAENQPQTQSQDSPQTANVPLTGNPSKLDDPQTANVGSLPSNILTEPVVSIIPEKDVAAEQPGEDNNIFIMSPTSPPLFSQNQIKSEEPTSISNINDNKNPISSTEKNEVENQQPSSDDKPASAVNMNINNVLISSTEVAPEINNESPQASDENIEHSTETKPIEKIINNDVTSKPENSHEPTPINNEHNDNRFGSNNLVSSEPELIPTTETNKDVDSATIQQIHVDDFSQDNRPQNEDHIAPNSETEEHQNALQTDSPVEIEASTNKYPSYADNQENDVTTVIPQQQIADNNIPVQPIQSVVNDPNEPIKNQEETKIPTNLAENSTPEKSPNNNGISEMSNVQNSDETSKLTESPIIDTNYVKQSITTQTPEQIENDSVTLLVQTQDKPVNENEDHTSVYPGSSLSDNNNLSTATGLSQNNEENVTPLTDKIDSNTKTQDSSDSFIQNQHKDNFPESITIPPTQQVNQDNQGSSETVDIEKNVDTTNSYAEEPSILQTTNSPAIQADNNEANSPENSSSNEETNVSNLPTNVVPQHSVSSDETSTQYIIVDSSTNSSIQEPSIVNTNNNVEENINDPTNLEITNQDSNTESEILVTQTTTEKNVLPVDSNKTPTNDVTMETVSTLPEHTNVSGENSNEVVNEKPSEISKKPDYVIDITTISYVESSNIPESINIEDQVIQEVEITTSNAENYNDETTEINESVQSGVPGEGSCLIDFVTYAHKAEIPKSNPCHEKCECLNSIVTCTSVNCPPAPPQHRNCIPLHPGNESWCCPTYMCDGGIEGMLFETHNPIGSPQLISTIVLEDKPSEENNQNTPADEEVSSTPIPQVAIEYNTLAPDQIDPNSDINLQNNNGVTEIPEQTETPINKFGDTVGTSGVNDQSVTIANSEAAENDKPNESDKLSENEKLGEQLQSSNDKNPVVNENLGENSDPTESNQSAENEKPIGDSEADITTVSYVDNVQKVTNKPESSNNMEEQNTLINKLNESQDYPAPSTDLPSYETTITNILQTDDQNQSQQNSESNNSLVVTTVTSIDSAINQQVDNHKIEEVDRLNSNGEFDRSPVIDTTDLPFSNGSPVEGTQTPTILADEKPSTIENNTNGLRPSSVDDIISSVNMVKDAVKNSLESSSKPTEIYYQTTYETINNYQPTVLPEDSASPLAENAFSDKINESPTTISSINVISELPTSVNSEKLPEISTANESSNDSGVSLNTNITPSVSSDQEVSTNSPLFVTDKQEIPAIPSSTNNDIIANQPGETVYNTTPEITTTPNSQNSVGQDLTHNEPSTASDSILPQSNVELNTNLPETIINNKISDTTTPVTPSGASENVLTDDAVNRPAEQEKPETESPILLNSDVNADKVQAEVSTQAAVSQSSFEPANTGISGDNDKRFGTPSSSPAPSEPATPEVDNKRPQESDDNGPIPLDTEDSSLTPSSNTPFAPPPQPTYTSIPQSTWTQKPFHHDSTSEAPAQPDQGFPDDYDEENEAVYGPGTCRYGGKVYVSAQQVPRDDPCDFCFCFRGDIICLQQSCPPPIFGCYQENIQGFCCPRYECPVAQATLVNTTTTTTTTTAVPPHFFANAYRGAARRAGCLIHGHAYRVGEDVGIASGPCLECICGADGKMKCDPKSCGPEPLIRKMMAEAVDQKRR